MLVILGALLEIALALLRGFLLLQIVEVRHHQAASMELFGHIVGDSHFNDLTLIIVIGLLDVHGLIILADSQGNHFFRDAADFLGAGQGRLDAAIPDQIGDLVTQQRLTLIGRTAQLTLRCHGEFLLTPWRAVTLVVGRAQAEAQRL